MKNITHNFKIVPASNRAKKVFISLFLLVFLISNFAFVGVAEARHDEKPLCYLAFWRDDRCEDDDNNQASSPAPLPAPAPANQAPVWTTGQTVFNVKTGELLQLTVSAYDPNNDPITYGVSFLPIGAGFDPGTKTFSWTPSNAQSGIYLVQFSAYDGKTYSFQSVTVTVAQNFNSGNNTSTNGNRKPVLSSIGTKYVSVNQVLEFAISATDADGDYLEYSVLNLPSGAIFDQASRTFSWIPNGEQIGNHVASFRVSDGKDFADAGTIIYVSAPNNKPYFTNATPPSKARIGQSYFYDFNALDADNDPLVFSLSSAPSGMTIHASTGIVQWTPAPLQTGFSYVSVMVSDGRSQAVFAYYIFADDGSIAPASNPNPGAPIRPNPITSEKLKISEIKIKNDGGEIIIGWKTNLPSTSRVIYDTASQADRTKDFTYANATAEIKDLSTDHKVNLEGLEIETVYFLRLVSKTADQVAITQEIAFIELEGGRVQSLLGASLLDIIGPLFTNSFFLWLIIGGLGISIFILYRRIQKATSPI